MDLPHFHSDEALWKREVIQIANCVTFIHCIKLFDKVNQQIIWKIYRERSFYI